MVMSCRVMAAFGGRIMVPRVGFSSVSSLGKVSSSSSMFDE